MGNRLNPTIIELLDAIPDALDLTPTELDEFAQAVRDQIVGHDRSLPDAIEIVTNWWVAGVPLPEVGA